MQEKQDQPKVNSISSSWGHTHELSLSWLDSGAKGYRWATVEILWIVFCDLSQCHFQYSLYRSSRSGLSSSMRECWSSLSRQITGRRMSFSWIFGSMCHKKLSCIENPTSYTNNMSNMRSTSDSKGLTLMQKKSYLNFRQCNCMWMTLLSAWLHDGALKTRHGLISVLVGLFYRPKWVFAAAWSPYAETEAVQACVTSNSSVLLDCQIANHWTEDLDTHT